MESVWFFRASATAAGGCITYNGYSGLVARRGNGHLPPLCLERRWGVVRRVFGGGWVGGEVREWVLCYVGVMAMCSRKAFGDAFLHAFWGMIACVLASRGCSRRRVRRLTIDFCVTIFSPLLLLFQQKTITSRESPSSSNVTFYVANPSLLDKSRAHPSTTRRAKAKPLKKTGGAATTAADL